MDITLLCYLPSVAGLMLIGLAIFLKNARNRISLSFFAVAMTIALWLLALCISYLHINYEISLWALRAGVAIGTFIAPALLYFSIYFPTQVSKIPKLFNYAVFVPAVLLFLLSFTPFLIPAVAFRQYSVAIRGVGSLYTIQSLYEITGVVLALGILLYKARKVTRREKTQIVLVVAGLLIAVAVNIVSNYILVLTHAATYFSDLAAGVSFVVFVGATAYAILRHHLFDMRLAITRTIAFTLTVGIVSVSYSFVVLVIVAPLVTGGQIQPLRDVPQLLVFLPPAIIIGLTVHSLQQGIARITRNIFFQDAYDSREVLDRLSDALISDNDLGVIMHRGLEVLSSALQPSHVLFVVLDDTGGVYKQQVINRKLPSNVLGVVDATRKVKTRISLRDEMSFGEWLPEFEQEDVSLVLRLVTGKKMTGALYFGPRQNGRSYTRQDTELLNVSAKNFGIAIENAKKYQQIATFADTMHKEVLRQTASLRRANKKLKTLDALKDDFISMASHQLRSPATSVHDAIRMLDQDYVAPEERKKILQLAEASSERLVGVVTDMLSVARIQAGHFTIEKTYIDLVELAGRAIMQASVLAAEKHITLQLEKPDRPVNLQADRAKLNEIMANYIENAIQYSDEGTTVVVTLKQDDGKVYFEIRDSGIGVPAEEQKSLFTKFYRATNARKEHPNGNGIGLFVVKTVVVEHGGNVYYQPLEHGSVFGFWLPIP